MGLKIDLGQGVAWVQTRTVVQGRLWCACDMRRCSFRLRHTLAYPCLSNALGTKPLLSNAKSSKEVQGNKVWNCKITRTMVRFANVALYENIGTPKLPFLELTGTLSGKSANVGEMGGNVPTMRGFFFGFWWTPFGW